MQIRKITALLAALALFVALGPIGYGEAADQRIQYNEEMVGANHPTKTDTLNRALLVEHDTDGTHDKATAAQVLAGAATNVVVNPSVMNAELVKNLKPTVNVAVNKLDIFAKSNGAAPSSTNIITVAIPDGNGYTFRSRAAAVASGTGQIVLADAGNYWSKGSLDAEIKTAWLYAIWSTADGGIVWALSGYSGFTRVPAAGGAATDDDWFLLEASSSYTAVVTDYCVAVAKIRYQYDTADTPDHTIQATVLDAPQVIWNPRSDYGYQLNLATGVTSGGNLNASYVSVVVKQSGKYIVTAKVTVKDSTGSTEGSVYIATGSATYGSAVLKSRGFNYAAGSTVISANASAIMYLNAGDTIHLGVSVVGSGTRQIFADDWVAGVTNLVFDRVD